MKLNYLVVIIVAIFCSCQPSKQDLLYEVSATLSGITSVKYHAKHRYKSNGKLEFENTDTVNIEFTNDNSLQLKYYLNSEESKLIFNGEEIFQSITEEKIITTNKNDDPEYFNNPLIYSLSYLRQVLPILINNEKVTIKAKDTILNEIELAQFDFILDSFYIHPTNYSVVDFKDNSNFTLLVDKKNKMPYKLIIPNGSDGMSSQTYTDIKTNIVFDKQLWSEDQLPTDYIRMTEQEYFDIRKNKMNSHLGKNLTNWTLPEITTEAQIDLTSLGNQVLLLDFWFKGCAPCISSIPSLNNIASKYSGKDFKLYGVEFQTNDRSSLQNYVEKNSVKYSNLYSGKEMALHYGITSGPTFMIVDKGGEIIYIKSEYSDENMKIIEEIIEENL